jgi:hypothetical protein
MGKKPRGARASATLRREIAKAAAVREEEASEEAWNEEVEEIFKDTHPYCRCDRLSNVVLWVSIFTLIYWTVAGRFGYLQ